MNLCKIKGIFSVLIYIGNRKFSAQCGTRWRDVRQAFLTLSSVRQAFLTLSSVRQTFLTLPSVRQAFLTLSSVRQAILTLFSVRQAFLTLSSVHQAFLTLSSVRQAFLTLSSVRQAFLTLSSVCQTFLTLSSVRQAFLTLSSVHQAFLTLSSVRQAFLTLSSVRQAFLTLYVDETATPNHGQRPTVSEDDNPPSPMDMDTMDNFLSQQPVSGSPGGRQKADGLRFQSPMTPPSNPLTPASPSTQRLTQVRQQRRTGAVLGRLPMLCKFHWSVRITFMRLHQSALHDIRFNNYAGCPTAHPPARLSLCYHCSTRRQPGVVSPSRRPRLSSTWWRARPPASWRRRPATLRYTCRRRRPSCRLRSRWACTFHRRPRSSSVHRVSIPTDI